MVTFNTAMGHVRSVTRGGALGMRLVSDAFNVALLTACAWATSRLYGKAIFYYDQSGGVPDPREFGCGPSQHSQCMGFLDGLLPTLHLRAYWLAHAWVAAILAVGFAVITAGGLRWAYWRVHDYLAA